MSTRVISARADGTFVAPGAVGAVRVQARTAAREAHRHHAPHHRGTTARFVVRVRQRDCPAGYGKTTLLAQCAAADDVRPRGWRDEADDPVTLARYVAAGLGDVVRSPMPWSRARCPTTTPRGG